jgi:hypothetical protein
MIAAQLEEAGIKVFLTGEVAASTFTGVSGFGPQVLLQVAASDRKLAQDILTDLAREKTLEPGWEDEVEANAEMWLCPLCGCPVEQTQAVCPDCGTART